MIGLSWNLTNLRMSLMYGIVSGRKIGMQLFQLKISSEIFLDRFFSTEIREEEAWEFIKLRQGSMTV